MKGSFTVEAALIFPMVILAMAACINLSIELHSEVKSSAEKHTQVLELKATDIIEILRVKDEVFEDA